MATIDLSNARKFPDDFSDVDPSEDSVLLLSESGVKGRATVRELFGIRDTPQIIDSATPVEILPSTRLIVNTYGVGVGTALLPPAVAPHAIQLLKAVGGFLRTALVADGTDTINGDATWDAFDNDDNSDPSSMWLFCYEDGLWTTDYGDSGAAGLRLAQSLNTRLTAVENGVVGATQTVSSTGTTAISAGVSIVRVTANGAVLLTLPTPANGATILILKANTSSGTVTVDPGSNTVNGSTTDYVLDGSATPGSATTARGGWTLIGFSSSSWEVA